MKKITYLMTMLAAAWMIQGCGGSSTTTDKADSANEAKADTSAMADSAGTNPGITVEESDAKFAVDAANGGMAEVALAKLALQKSANAQVKEFANMMIADHGKANEELMALAKAKNITLPATVSEDKQKEADDMAKKMGNDFDKAYADAMVKDHEKTVKMFEHQATVAKDPDLKAFVDKTLPTLKMHTEHIAGINQYLNK
ncbi:DUF4142 domain-containing protein [Mucilaginibacter myungsuensis]|uniref:DUF4142 domain-containing protein n=1 Tax=Mucilaginibacter myungsuensis TaxID=649104 RepID=A0A929PYJ7_9SPHI|nr:DUF4142 domain-containing protein [Mucilaginibacter myungsuensis]MBE9663515.1 DUF4142 domain-containing protein [Mucilaginibacter myungsuensis]MDN3600253.1 DUF4142 domain-containing protein [Mucilaginibacter myungsuensis]